MSLYDRIRKSRTLPLVESIRSTKHREALDRVLFEEDEKDKEPEISHFGHLAQRFGKDRLGARQAGSQSDGNLHDLIPHHTPVEEYRPEGKANTPVARYFRLHKKHVDPKTWSKINPRQGVKAYGDLSPEERKMVKVRPGHVWGKAQHGDGRELYLDRPAHDKHFVDADHITFITSRKGDPWTFHPGKAMATHDSDNKRGTHGHWHGQGHDPEKISDERHKHIRPEDHENPNLDPQTAVKLHSGT